MYLCFSNSHHTLGHLVVTALEAEKIKTITKEISCLVRVALPLQDGTWLLHPVRVQSENTLSSHMKVEGRLAEWHKKSLILATREEPSLSNQLL